MDYEHIELLAPAGSPEIMKACYSAGADAVYMGLPRFSARAFAGNATEESYMDAIDYAHVHGKKLYLTVNTLFKEEELFSELYGLLLPLYEAGLDAVIMQDTGAIAFVHSAFPDLPIHASTQCTVTSPQDLLFYRRFGVKRVVPARELSLKEVRALADTGVEVECFIHGALCYSYSGQCLFSSLAGGRSGNRGRCAQPCRLPYQVSNESGTVIKRGAYILSLKDLNTLELLPELLDAGVTSLKIEGRMKKAEYAAGVTSVYRKYLDLLRKNGKEGYHTDPADQKLLFSLFNRQGFTDGYYRKHNAASMLTIRAPEFREEDTQFTASVRENYIRKEHKTPVSLSYSASAGEPFRISLAAGLPDRPFVCSFESQEKILPAEKRASGSADAEKQLLKLGNTDFSPETISGSVGEGVFLPVGSLNEWRRQAAGKLREEILSSFRRKADPGRIPGKPAESGARTGEPFMLSALLRTEEQLSACLSCAEVKRVYLYCLTADPARYRKLAEEVRRSGKQVWLALPQVFRDRVGRWFLKYAETIRGAGFDGFLAGSFGEAELLRIHCPGKPVIADHNLYAFNSLSVQTLESCGFSSVTVPVELNRHEAEKTGFRGAELILYGRYPMMVSANCIRNTAEGCDRKAHIMTLTDRMNNRFPVINECAFCMNTILNAAPVSLLDCRGEAERTGICSGRLQFTVESGEETAEILKLFAAVYGRGEPFTGNVPGYTRGHFKRGVD